jgi:pyrimidine deaminase RibD-like protein
MMARCIELSRIAVSKGEYPFSAVIALDGQVVVEAINSTIRDGDVTRHAEVIALSGTNGAATIIGNSRQNLGNLGCWGCWWGLGGERMGNRGAARVSTSEIL